MRERTMAATKRRHARLKTQLLGRYLLEDGREARCMMTDISLSGVALAAPERGDLGETVVLYVDQIGRLEGNIVRHTDDGFAIALDVSSRALERMARRLETVITGDALNPRPERRPDSLGTTTKRLSDAR